MDSTFTRFCSSIARAAGNPIAFAVACLSVIVWAVGGPVLGFSDTWQLIINTGSSVITLLMVFIIQNTQNRDSAAIQAKLDELIRSSAAQDHFIGIDRLTQAEVEQLRIHGFAKRDANESPRATDKGSREQNG